MTPDEFLKIAMEAADASDRDDMVEFLEYGDNDEPFESDDYVIKLEDGEFGYEGGPSRLYFVLSFEDKETTHKVYISVTGEHNSWNGSDWSYGLASFVKPKVVSVTEWEKA
jgi:hypothetical protein